MVAAAIESRVPSAMSGLGRVRPSARSRCAERDFGLRSDAVVDEDASAPEHGARPQPTRRGGRPRSEQSRQKVLAAAGELMLEGGLDAATIEAIAARAGVSKTTIYRWWPSRAAVALEGLMLIAASSWDISDGASAMQTLTEHMRAVVRLFSQTPAGPLMRALAAEAQSQPETADALRAQWLEPRRAVSLQILRDGIAAGEFRPDLDLEAAVDVLYGPLYYRLLFGHLPLEEEAIQPLIDLARHALTRSTP
jgi:AcrR family transcriptional regulator